jgi:hypothetical protein
LSDSTFRLGDLPIFRPPVAAYVAPRFSPIRLDSLAGAKLPSELVSAGSMLVFALWRRSAVDDTQSSSRSLCKRESGCAPVVTESPFFCYCSFVICGGLVWQATRIANVGKNWAALFSVSLTSNDVLANHR